MCCFRACPALIRCIMFGHSATICLQEIVDNVIQLHVHNASQISRIRETIGRVLNEDTTLAERVRTLFREQGVTLVSILTAVGMAISTLVLALTGGRGTVTPPSPPPAPSDKGGLREWAKKTLQALGRVLAKLAGKAAAALPGIIGSIVSWLLSTLGKAAGWLAEHVWALAVAVGGLLFLAARELLAPHKWH